MPKKVIYDPSFWILISVNIFCIYYYQKHPEGFPTVVWTYWLQSVLIGLFNFLDLLTVKHPDPASLTINDKPMSSSMGAKGCTSVFFLFHYQFFHLAYAIFIAVQVRGTIDFNFILLTITAITIELTLGFIRNKRLQKDTLVNYGKLMMMPYLRIIPMHLMILVPAFLGYKASYVFLVLKLFADAGMYLLTRKMYTKPAVI